MSKKLEVGEKYLSISVIGHNPIVAFRNKEKKNDKSPDFIGQGVSVWVNKKKAPEQDNATAVEDVV